MIDRYSKLCVMALTLLIFGCQSVKNLETRSKNQEWTMKYHHDKKKKCADVTVIYENLNQDSVKYYKLHKHCSGPIIVDQNDSPVQYLSRSLDCDFIIIPTGFIDSFSYNIYKSFGSIWGDTNIIKNKDYIIKMGQGDSYMELPFKYQPHKFNNTDDLPALVLSDTTYLEKGLMITFDLNHDIDSKNLELVLLQWPYIEQNYTNLKKNKIGIKISKSRKKLIIFFPYKEILDVLERKSVNHPDPLLLWVQNYYKNENKSIEINKDLISQKAAQN